MGVRVINLLPYGSIQKRGLKKLKILKKTIEGRGGGREQVE